MAVHKKILSAYRATGGLLVVLIILTAFVFYVVLGPNQTEAPQGIVPPDAAILSDEQPASIQGTGTCDVLDSSLDSQEFAFLSLINAYRTQNGLEPLAASSNLNRMATWTAEDLPQDANFTDHIDTQGRPPEARFSSCGVNQWQAENLYAGNESAQVALDAWIASPGHNTNMLEGRSTQIGIARYYEANSQYKWYWVTEFARGGNAADGGGGDAPGGGGTPPTSPPQPTQPPAVTNPPQQPGSPPTDSPKPTKVIEIAIKIDGVGTNGSLGENNMPVRPDQSLAIQVIDANNNIVKDTSGTINYDPVSGLFKGEVAIDSIDTGLYKTKLRMFNSLWKAVSAFVNEGLTTLPTTKIITGDIFGYDNILDVRDYNALIACIKQDPLCQEDLKRGSDLNIDGKVDERDLNIFYSALAKRQGD